MHRTATQLFDHLAAFLHGARTVSPLACRTKATSLEAQSLAGFAPETDFIRYALDNAAIVAITDIKGTITYINSKFCEISGYAVEELLGSNHRILNSGVHDVAYFRAMYRDIARGSIWHGEICNRRKDGTLYWVDTTIVPHVSPHGKVDSYTSIRFDITARKRLEDELRASKAHLKRMADLDPLTDLSNRRRFQEFVAELVAESACTDRGFHLALLDIDTFKEINDSFGHFAGDQLLQTVAQRLRAIDDSRLFISRLGGDEFGLILRDAAIDEADALFEQALGSIRRPVWIGGTMRRCSASLGLATFPQHGEDAESLFKAADLALYQAKALGRDRGEHFHPSLKENADRKSELLVEIENGLQRDAFELHYQPIIPISGSRAVSLEALMRWRHPHRGLLTPGAFQDGFADPAIRAALGGYMLERVFRDVVLLREKHIPLNRVAINLTNSDFRSDTFLDRFFELSALTGIEPDQFCVEVTEGMFLGHGQKGVESGLRRLHHAGVEVALDDFGTGYASLTHLRQLPIDRLKIDRSFVANMVSSREDQAIVRGVIDIAHSLGKTVTAEGVETAEQMELLSAMGCDQLQGWYFGKACEAERLPAVLASISPIGRLQTEQHHAASPRSFASHLAN